MKAAAALVLLAILLAAALAPLYAARIARTDPFRATPMALVDGQPVLADNPGLGTTPLGPGFRGPYLIGPYLLGADALGRDVAARLLFGARLSLFVAGLGAGLALAAGILAGILAAYAGGWLDAALSALLDLLWAFPVYLLAISLAVILVNEGLHIGPVTLDAANPVLPALIIALVYLPYVARPIRAETNALLGRDLMRAAIAIGGTPAHILRRHLIPLLLPTIRALAPIVAAMALLTEAALSILGLGIQPPQASWGTLLADGQALIYTRPLVALAPGLAIAITVLALNTLADRGD